MAGIYIHYPFCKSKCYYCDFYSVTNLDLRDSFLKALKHEINLRKDFFGDMKLDTIYFGGGTPSLLAPNKMQEIINTLTNTFEFNVKPEITIEINPDDVGSSFVKELKKTSINRLSIGIQAFYNYYLQLMNRRHKVLGALKAVDTLQQAGYNNISIDLIYGIPELTMSEWEKTLEKAVDMNVQHISAYHLTFEKDTVFDQLKEKGMMNPIDEEDSFKQFEKMVNYLEKNDFIQYEISNFGRLGRFSKHNISYWNQEPYLGLGPAAHSFNGINRYWNISEINKYLRIDKNEKDISQQETLSPIDKFNEYLMTGFRTTWGIDLKYIEKTFGPDYINYISTRIDEYVENGYALKTGSKYLLTTKGMFTSDRLVSDLFYTNE